MMQRSAQTPAPQDQGGSLGIAVQDRSALSGDSRGGGFVRNAEEEAASASTRQAESAGRQVDVAASHTQAMRHQAEMRLTQGARQAGTRVVSQMEKPLQEFTDGDGRGSGLQLDYGKFRNAGRLAAIPAGEAGRRLSAGLGMNRLGSSGMIAGRLQPAPAPVHLPPGATGPAGAISRAGQLAAHAGRHVISSFGAMFTAGAASGVIMLLLGLVGIVALIAMFLPWLPGVAVDEQQRAAQGAPTGRFLGGKMGDDYPYKGTYSNDSMSPLGYAWGNCTDFVAWRINRDAGVTGPQWQYTWANLTPNGGDGGSWARPGNLEGWVTTTTPAPGDVFSVPPGVASWGASGGPYGHVGYIGAVNADGSVIAENYGGGEYFVFTKSAAEVREAIASGIVFKHNPAAPAAPGVTGGSPSGGDGGGTGGAQLSPTQAQEYAFSKLSEHGWGEDQRQCLVELWTRESSWRWNAENAESKAYGIAQALPAEKMNTHGSDWRTNAQVQIDWGLSYIKERYGSPCAADAFQRSNNWY